MSKYMGRVAWVALLSGIAISTVSAADLKVPDRSYEEVQGPSTLTILVFGDHGTKYYNVPHYRRYGYRYYPEDVDLLYAACDDQIHIPFPSCPGGSGQ